MVVFKNSVAVVTGGASGIGRALCLGAAARGARIAVVDVESGRAGLVVEEICASGALARAYRCDVADMTQVSALAEQIRIDFGGVNLVFNNAGVAAGGTVEDSTSADAAWMLSVNFTGVFNGIKAFLPLLRQAQAAGLTAHIVNTGSENSLGVPVIGPMSIYTATKHAVLGLSDALRRDLVGSGIGVSLLCPGLVTTDVFDARRNRPTNFGGPERASPEHAVKVRALLAAEGQDPALTAELCFAGMERGDFLIITDPKIRVLAEKRHQEVNVALDRIRS